MIEALRADSARLGDAYHQLFMGHDTDDAEIAARHLSGWIELQLQERKASFGA